MSTKPTPSTTGLAKPVVVQHESSADLAQRLLKMEVHNAELAAEVVRLTEAVAARDAFLAIAGHELRNPMTPIVVRLQLLRRLSENAPVPNAQVAHGIDEMEKSVLRFIKRATTLLDVTRMNSDTFAFHPVAVDIVGAARAVLDDLCRLSGHSRAELHFISTDDALFVEGDALAIEQILENLVSNGIKYGDGTPVVVSIATDLAGDMALIRVSDSGPGISPGNQARIFERFERAVSSTHRTGGFGVGLWLVRQLSEAMGGSVAITSLPDQGSTFCVALPLHCPGDAT